MKDEAKQVREKENGARKEIIQMKKMMRQKETLAAQQGNKVQSQDELLKRRSMTIQTLKKKIMEDQICPVQGTGSSFTNFLYPTFFLLF